jgi:hypothetical protein
MSMMSVELRKSIEENNFAKDFRLYAASMIPLVALLLFLP